MHKRRNICLLSVFLYTLLPVVAYAQSLDPIQFVFTPEIPAPHQKVIIEVQGVGTFLGDATITWQLNGKTIQSGIGMRSFSFAVGALGATSRVHVVINSKTQGTMVRDFTFLPSLMNLVWEADTSVPLPDADTRCDRNADSTK